MQYPNRLAGPSASVLALLLAATASTSLAQEVPAGLQQILNSAVKAIDAGDAQALTSLTQGDPHTVYAWDFRPGMGSSAFGGRLAWKAGLIRPPGSSEWQAVFWDYLPCESQGDHVHKVVESDGGWKIGPEIPETDSLGYRLTDHDIHVSFTPATHTGQFTDTVQVKRLDSSAGPLQMRLAADFPVDSVASGDTPVQFTQLGGVIYVDPPHAPSFSLTLTYHGSADHPNQFVGNYISQQEIVLAAYWYPVIARLPTTHSDTVTVAKGWSVMAQGNQLDHTQEGATETYKYRMDTPNCYFTLDAAPYHKYAKTINGRTYGVWLVDADQAKADKQLGEMDGSFRLFEKLWGPYPYDHFTIVETDQRGWPGALESYTFTTYGKGFMPSSNPHEWGHTWWGGFVPNTYLKDIWNESFATYSESVFSRYGSDTGNRALVDSLYWSRPGPAGGRAQYIIPLDKTADALFGPSADSGYSKGGMVMQNLEETLGMETLARCMKSFREQFDGSENAATWDDFEAAVDKVTGQDYSWWFDQWVRRPGLPALRWENVSEQVGPRGVEVQADIVQSGAPYQLKVPVWMKTRSGEVVKSTQAVSGERTHIALVSMAKPVSLLMDPEMRIPRVLTTQELGGGMGRGPIVGVRGAKDAKLAEFFPRFGVQVKTNAQVTRAELKSSDLVLIGSADSNALWTRLASHCPFAASASGVNYHGKSYPGGGAIAVTKNPFNPARTALWITGNPDNLPDLPELLGMSDHVSVAVFDSRGRLVDGAARTVQGGPSVYVFH